MLYGIVLRDHPKQVISLAKAKIVPPNMREFLSWAQRHYRIDVATSTVQRIDSVPREIYNVLEATRSASSNRDEELANRVLKDTTITKQQLDFATRMVLEQVSRLSDGDYERSAMFQLFLDCVDRAIASSTALVSFQRQPMKFDDNRTLSLRVVDPIADEGVWAVIDDGCNSCCQGELWRQNAEAKMKTFLAFTLFGCTGRQLLSMALERVRRVES